jgi:TfoX/Sxy family transcriptional regulator of competence genes
MLGHCRDRGIECLHPNQKLMELDALFFCFLFLTMKSAEETYNALAAKLAENNADVKISQMFGMPSLKIKGKAFAGVYEDAMIFKLTGEAHKRALAEPGAKLFEPMAGRPMKEWVEVPFSSSKKWETYAVEALEYVSKLKK